MIKASKSGLMVLALAAAACADEEDDFNNPPPTSGEASERVVERSDIASDQSGAMIRDSNLVNAWGLAFNPAGPAWVSATESGVSFVFDASGNQLIPPVEIPAAGDEDEAEPTGQVFNADSTAFLGDAFIFVSEDGGISGWQQPHGGEAVMRVDNSEHEAIYKGVTVAVDGNGASRLYATDFYNGRIDVFDASYEPLAITGDFLDPDLPDGFAPFNVEYIDGVLYVTYAKQDDEGEDDVRGAGNGYVDIYDLDGVFISRLISANELNSPWGLTMTPASFTAAPRRLLVGNFGDGLINVYSVDLSSATGGTGASAVFEGALLGPDGENIAIDGLWALKFAPSTDAGFATDQLYFTAGPDDEEHGVFGGLQTSTLSASAGTGGTGGTDGTGGSPPAAGSGGSGPPLGY